MTCFNFSVITTFGQAKDVNSTTIFQIVLIWRVNVLILQTLLF